jgi:hypothetical protein
MEMSFFQGEEGGRWFSDRFIDLWENFKKEDKEKKERKLVRKR